MPGAGGKEDEEAHKSLLQGGGGAGSVDDPGRGGQNGEGGDDNGHADPAQADRNLPGAVGDAVEAGAPGSAPGQQAASGGNTSDAAVRRASGEQAGGITAAPADQLQAQGAQGGSTAPPRRQGSTEFAEMSTLRDSFKVIEEEEEEEESRGDDWRNLFKSTSESKSKVATETKVRGLVQATIKGREMAKRAKEQSQAMHDLHDIMENELAITPLHMHRRTLREQRSLREDDSVVDTRDFPFLIFHPFAPWRLVWDVSVMVLLVYSFVAVPVRLAFDRSSDECNSDFFQQSRMFYLDLATDAVFLCDIFVTFRTAYVDDSGGQGQAGETKLVTDWKLIALRYAKSFLIIDICSSMPMDLFLLSACNGLNGAQKLLRGPSALKIIRLVRVLRLLRITRLRQFLQKVRDVLHVHPGMLRVIRFFFIVILCAHYNACIFFYIGEIEASPQWQSWTTEASFYMVDERTGVAGDTTPRYMAWYDQYLVSLYWSTTAMTTVGYGDITPVTVMGTIYSIVVLLQAGIAFSYMVGNMANLLSRVNPRHQRFQGSMEQWEDFMHSQHIPTDTRQRIRGHKNYLYHYPVIKLPAFARKGMSRTLLRDVTAHLYRAALHSLPMFKGLDENALTELALALEPVQFAPDAIIYREDEVGDCMYFISHGDVVLSMLMIPQAEKEEQGIKIVTDMALKDSITIVPGRKGAPDQIRLRKSDSVNGITWTAGGEEPSDDKEMWMFKWVINQDSHLTYFGESCLTSRSMQRKTTAVAQTWCTLFRLDKTALQRIAMKNSNMGQIYRNMQRTHACKLLRAVRIMIYGRRARYARSGKLIVRVDEGRNMPKMDSFMGLCDAYCALSIGFPEPQAKTYKTMVQYNKFNPAWKETFVFPIDFSLKKLRQGMPVVVHLSVFDYDVLGDHDLIGSTRCDLSKILSTGLEKGINVKHSSWHTLSRKIETGSTTTVKGLNRRKTKIRLSFQVHPPRDGFKPPGENPELKGLSPSNVPRHNKQDLMSIADHGAREGEGYRQEAALAGIRGFDGMVLMPEVVVGQGEGVERGEHGTPEGAGRLASVGDVSECRAPSVGAGSGVGDGGDGGNWGGGEGGGDGGRASGNDGLGRAASCVEGLSSGMADLRSIDRLDIMPSMHEEGGGHVTAFSASGAADETRAGDRRKLSTFTDEGSVSPAVQPIREGDDVAPIGKDRGGGGFQGGGLDGKHLDFSSEEDDGGEEGRDGEESPTGSDQGETLQGRGYGSSNLLSLSPAEVERAVQESLRHTAGEPGWEDDEHELMMQSLSEETGYSVESVKSATRAKPMVKSLGGSFRLNPLNADHEISKDPEDPSLSAATLFKMLDRQSEAAEEEVQHLTERLKGMEETSRQLQASMADVRELAHKAIEMVIKAKASGAL